MSTIKYNDNIFRVFTKSSPTLVPPFLLTFSIPLQFIYPLGDEHHGVWAMNRGKGLATIFSTQLLPHGQLKMSLKLSCAVRQSLSVEVLMGR